MNQINTPKEQKLLKYKIKCSICQDKIETDQNPLLFMDNVCSLECYNEMRTNEKAEYYMENIKIIPPKYRDIDFEDKEMVKKLLKQSIFITGQVGTGKTTLMATLMKRYLWQEMSIEWINFPAFIMKLQNMFKDNTERPYEYAEDIATSRKILAIDDLGAEKLTEFVRQIMYYIVNEREQRQLPLIITSNFDLKKIDEMIDTRISSRIMGICKIIKLSGKDKRFNEKDFNFKNPVIYHSEMIKTLKARDFHNL